MIDVEYGKLALYCVGAQISFNALILCAIHVWKMTIRMIHDDKLKKLLHDPKHNPCLETFHCHCDEPEGHVKLGTPHISRKNLVAWKEHE